jgi:LuxR family maltose regulon positive regulatory protein
VNLTQAQPALSHLDHLPDVLAYLERQSQVAETSGLMWLRIKVYALQALAYYALGDSTQAMEKLGHALSLAEPEGYIRIFVDEGAPMAALLQLAATKGFAPNYIDKLLAVFPAEEQTVSSSPVLLRPPAPLLIEPLTPRELEVLQLIAAGHSNQEIARALVVSVGTVKKHLNNIFGKLNVTSRTQAVARAREFQLL